MERFTHKDTMQNSGTTPVMCTCGEKWIIALLGLTGRLPFLQWQIFQNRPLNVQSEIIDTLIAYRTRTDCLLDRASCTQDMPEVIQNHRTEGHIPTGETSATAAEVTYAYTWETAQYAATIDCHTQGTCLYKRCLLAYRAPAHDVTTTCSEV